MNVMLQTLVLMSNHVLILYLDLDVGHVLQVIREVMEFKDWILSKFSCFIIAHLLIIFKTLLSIAH